MTQTFHPTTTYSEAAPPRGRWLWFLITGVIANVALWSIALIYLKTAEPAYVSGLSVTLPNAGSETRIDLPQIGNTTSQERTPYDRPNSDPREGYKYIATSKPVIDAAAAELGISSGEFGRPRVETIDNTTLMELQVEGETPEQAQQKAIALYDAFQERLNQLRIEERTRRDSGVQRTLQDAQRKLETAQARLSQFKASSGLTSGNQVDQLATNIEQLRSQRAVLFADQQQANAQLRQISGSLNISSNQAADAFKLGADQLFQQNLSDYSQASASLNALSQQLGANHPIIVRERTRQEAARDAMLNRGRTVLGRAVDETSLAQLSLASVNQSGSSSREGLFSQVITAQVDQQGLTARAAELDRQISLLEGRLARQTQSLSTLEALNRDVTISEALFSSALTRLDLGASDSFGSYPQTQLLTEPSLPSEPAGPKPIFVIFGATIGSLLITTGLITLWLRGRRPSHYTTIGSFEPDAQTVLWNGSVPEKTTAATEVNVESK
ncbi:hypothetical protein IQ268_27910 [Oculatella sp. LEGE 06141]|uniref:GumC family protein n=1 Tax=Oculatella sp. LEGE 06141 TaxID=1828648 RepID=UPI00187E4E65|nr:hypothetical protein [Oculatella sp. LEGE 06141]MBE9182377.1 hypothetical protein [Oculatella sp. LEGE 06141]